MKKFPSAAYAGVVVIGLCAITFGQSSARSGGKTPSASDQSQVVVDKDRYSGATTITLKPQKLIDSPEHLLTMSAESKTSDKPLIGFAEADERVMLKFDLQTTAALDYGDLELHFLVDGKPLRGGSIAGGGSPLLKPKPVSPYTKRRTLFGSLSVPTLGEIARGRKVEMRLGSVEATLSPELLGKLGEFVRFYQQAKGNTQR